MMIILTINYEKNMVNGLKAPQTKIMAYNIIQISLIHTCTYVYRYICVHVQVSTCTYILYLQSSSTSTFLSPKEYLKNS